MKPNTLKVALSIAKMLREKFGIFTPDERAKLIVRFVGALEEVKDDDKSFHEWLRYFVFSHLTDKQKRIVVEVIEREIRRANER